jgi:septum site-determining protein MinC
MDSKPEKKVKLKGSHDGFIVTLDPEEPFEEIKEQTRELFINLRQLAKGARISIDGGEPGVSDDLLMKLGVFLKARFGVGDVVKRIHAEHHPDQSDEGESIVEIIDEPEGQEVEDMKMMAGRVRSGQKITAEKHLVILGDVNPGGEVYAGGDILILGSLCGIAVAGQSGNENSIILAFDFRPTQVQIGGVVAAGGMSSASGKKNIE